MKGFEMANADNPEGLIKATQKALLKAMTDVFSDVKKESQMPGMTWEQIEYFLDKFEKKEVEIIFQGHPL